MQALKFAGKTLVEQVAVELIGKAFDMALEKSLKSSLGLFKSDIEKTLRNLLKRFNSFSLTKF